MATEASASNAAAALTHAAFEIERELGAGSSSAVYLARRNAQHFAVKVLTASDAGAARKLRREAAALGRLNHPNLVKLYEVDEHEGRPYLVLELVDGASLAAEIARRGRLPEPEVLGIARALASVLAEIHQHGYVHRDLKPSNVLIDKFGVVKLIDLGLIHAWDDSGGGSGEFVGTPLYAAPEQAGLLSRPVDARSDLYSLGCLLFEALTGRPPFLGAAGVVLQQHATAEPPAIRELVPEVGEVFAAIIACLLAKDPDDRYQSAESLRADLSRVQQLELNLRKGKPIELGRVELRSTQTTGDVALIGRTAELARLKRVYEHVKLGKGRLVVLEGEAGVGKSRLIRELISIAALDRTRVLTGRCVQAELRGCRPFREALDGYATALSRGQLSERAEEIRLVQRVAGPSAAALSSLSVGLGRLLGEHASTAKFEHTEQLGEALADFLVALVEKLHRPMMVVVDDVQWIDPGSRQILAAIAARLSSVPILLVCAARSDRASAEATASLWDELPPCPTDRMYLAPLSESASRSLIQTLLGGREMETGVGGPISRRAHGNPFSLSQYVRALVEAGGLRLKDGVWRLEPQHLHTLALPSDVFELINGRVAALGGATLEVISAAALMGLHFERPVVEHASGKSSAAVGHALTEAMHAGLLESNDGERFSFVHNRIREALLARISPDRQREVHHAIALALSGRGAEGPLLVALAQHFLLGYPERVAPQVIETASLAGELCLRDFANDSAVSFFKSALSLIESTGASQYLEGRIRQGLGEACARVADYDSAILHLQRALELATTQYERARIHAALAMVRTDRSQYDDAVAECEAGLRELERPLPSGTLRQWASIVGTLLLVVVLDGLGLFFGRARGEEIEVRITLARLYKAGIFSSLFRLRIKTWLLLQWRAILNAHLLGAHRESSEMLGFVSFAFAALKLKKASRRAFERAEAIARSLNDRVGTAQARAYAGPNADMLGEPVRGEQLLRGILERESAYLTPFIYNCGLCQLGYNLLVRGYPRQASEVLRTGAERRQAKLSSHLDQLIWFKSALGASEALQGNSAEARRCSVESQSARESFAKYGQHDLPTLSVAGHYLFSCLEQDDWAERLPSALEDYEQAVKLFDVRLVPYLYKHHLVVAAYARLGLFVRAPAPERTLAAHELKVALARLASIANVPIFRAHLYVLRAASARLAGRTRRAAFWLWLAERDAARADSKWAELEIAVERARLAKQRDDLALCRRYVEVAVGVAARQGLSPRLRRLEREFGEVRTALAALRSAASTGDWASQPLEASQSTSRHLDALIQLTLSANASLDPLQQARVVLDEVVRTLGAERGLLFLTDDATGALHFAAGRTFDGKDVTDITGYLAGAIDRVRSSLAPVVVSGVDNEALASDSEISAEIRSVMAAPLVLRHRLVGVIYVDSKLAKGLFSREDAALLRVLGSQVAISLETARAAAQEASRRSRERDQDLTKALASHVMPRASAVAVGRLELAGVFQPGAELECGFWSHEALPEGHVEVVVGQASGGGAGGAVVVAQVLATYHMLRAQTPALDVAELVRRLTHEMDERFATHLTVALSGVVVDPTSGAYTFWSTGGPGAFRLARDGAFERWSAGQDPAGRRGAGLIKQGSLAPGDRVALFTQSLSSSPLGDGRELGVEGVQGLLQEASRQRPQAAVSRVAETIRDRSANPRELVLAVLDFDPRSADS